MKVKVIVFCILFAQTSGSFFEEFRGAMSSVENSFGRLVTDVVTDVGDTIECTILAVKKVLSLGGFFYDSSEYDRRCGGGRTTNNYIQETNENYSPSPPILTATPNPPNSDSSKKSVPEIISDEIQKSIVNINSTIDLIEESETHEKMVNVSNSLLHESNRLANVSALLRRELSNISKDVKKELGKVETDKDNPKIQGIWNEIKSLHSMELSHKSTHESAVIHNILDEVLSVLRGYNSNETTKLASTEELNDTYTEIKNQFIKMEEEESQVLDVGEDDIEDNLTVTRTDSQIEIDFPVTFKGLAKQIMDDTSRTLRLEEDLENNEDRIVETTEPTLPTPIIEDDIMESPDYVDLFDIAPKDSNSRKEAVESAKALIEKSKENDAIMDSYFKKTSEVGYDLFDSPDLFEFAF